MVGAERHNYNFRGQGGITTREVACGPLRYDDNSGRAAVGSAILDSSHEAANAAELARAQLVAQVMRDDYDWAWDRANWHDR